MPGQPGSGHHEKRVDDDDDVRSDRDAADDARAAWWYVDAAGRREGPANFRVVRAQLRVGLLRPDTRVWREGLDEWRQVREVPIFAQCCAPNGGEREGYGNRGHGRHATSASAEDMNGRGDDSGHLAGGVRAGASPAIRPPDTATIRPPRVAHEWFVVGPGAREEGPMTTGALIDLLRGLHAGGDGEATDVSGTWVWSGTVGTPEWAPATTVPELAPALIAAGLMPSASSAGDGTTDVLSPLPPPPPPPPREPGHVVGRVHVAGSGPLLPPAPTGAAAAASLDAALGEAARLAGVLGERDAEITRLNEELRAARELAEGLERENFALRDRLAAGKVGVHVGGLGAELDSRGEAAAAAEVAQTSAARAELEARTAELVRLKAVLRGKLLRRVMEDADAVTRSIVTLDNGG